MGKSIHQAAIIPLRPDHIGWATQAVAESSLKLGYIASLAMTSAMTTISRQDSFDKVWSSANSDAIRPGIPI